jgi:hypothetical protein
MAKTVAQKLLIKDGETVSFAGAGADERAALGALPDGVTEVAPAEAAVSVTFVRTRDELMSQFGTELPALTGARAVWFLYRRAARRISTGTPSSGRPVRSAGGRSATWPWTTCGRRCASVRSPRGRRR